MKRIPDKWLVVITVLLGTFTMILNNSSLNPAIPHFMEIFDVDAVAVSWIITIFMVVMGITMPLTGYLGERFGKKRIYLLGLGIFITGSLLGSVSWDLTSVILFRALQGIGGGLMMPLSMVLIFEVFPKNERGMATGVWGIAIMMAPTIGPTIGGIIVELGSWSWLFLMNVPTGILGLVLGFFFLKSTTRNPSLRFDWMGFITVTIGVGAVLFALGRISDVADIRSPLNLTLLVVGLLCLMAFIWIEWNKEEPLLNVKIFKIQTYSLSTIVASVQGASLFTAFFMIPLLVQNVYGFNTIVTGLVFLPSALFTGIFMTIAGRQLDRNGPKRIVTIGLLVTGVSTLMLGMLDLHSPIWIVFVLMMFRGMGLGMSNMPATTAGLNAVPDKLISQGSAMNNVLRRMSSSTAIVLISIYFELRRSRLIADGQTLQEGSLQALNEGFIMVGLLSLLCVPAAIKLKKPVIRSVKKGVSASSAPIKDS